MNVASRDRSRVAKLAKQNPAAALVAARKIGDPWFRAQALGWVARFAADGDLVRVAEEALAAGRRCEDAYQAVGSAAWPIRALVERGQQDVARQALDALGSRFADVDPASSRSEAVFLLYQAAFALGSEVCIRLVRELAAIQAADDHWRVSRNLVDALNMLAAIDPAQAAEVAARIPDERTRRKAIAALDQTARPTPRPFFR